MIFGRLEKRCAASRFAGLALPRAGADDIADLIADGAVEFREAEPFRLKVPGMDFPLVKRLFGFKLHDRHPLAVLSDEPFVGNVAGNAPRQFIHFPGHRAILVLNAGGEAGANYGDDHRSGYL